MKHICFVAAKSGGHIVPCLTLVTHYKKGHQNLSVTFISANNTLDKNLTKNHPLIDENIYLNLENIPYKKPLRIPFFCFQFMYAFIKMFFKFIKKRPIKIISSGSYIALPASFAAFVLRIPIELWELNVIPGKTIKWLAPFAQKINLCFPEAQKFFNPKKSVLALYPICYCQQDKENLKTARLRLSLDPHKKTIFILGGSQGSQELNKIILGIVQKNSLIAKTIQFIHQTGNDSPELTRKTYQSFNIPAYVFSYNKNLAPMYNATDLVISRAGAGALAEIQFFEKASIIIPLKTDQTNHQYYNATSFEKRASSKCTILEITQQKELETILNKLSV